MIRVFFFFMPAFAGLWIATQKLAALVQYDPLLGTSFQMMGSFTIIHGNISVGFKHFHSYIPDLFKQTYVYIYGGFLVGLLFLFVLQPPRRLDSHGSAHWGEYKDILGMDLISASGVV